MKCPVPCCCCGELVELSDAKFYTAFCECPTEGSCTHGLCPECAEAHGHNYED